MKVLLFIILLIVIGIILANYANNKHIKLYKRSILDYYKDYE